MHRHSGQATIDPHALSHV